MTTFDRHADTYDDVAESRLGSLYRARVRAEIEPLVSEAGQVLDLGCGTGLDAVWMATSAPMAVVHAVDASAAMVDLTNRRAADAGLSERVHASQLDLNDQVSLGPAASVDLVLANFGVVNCVHDLTAFGERLAALLRPGGHAVLVTMTSRCPSEWAQGAVTRNRALVERRRDGATTEAGYEAMELAYRGGRALADDLGAGFELVRCVALGTTLPTFEQRAIVETRPRLLRNLDSLDRLVSPLAARLGVGDHHVVVLRRTSP